MIRLLLIITVMISTCRFTYAKDKNKYTSKLNKPVEYMQIRIKNCSNVEMPSFIKVMVNGDQSDISYDKNSNSYIKKFSDIIDCDNIKSIKIVDSKNIVVDSVYDDKGYIGEEKKIICEFAPLFILSISRETSEKISVEFSDKNYKSISGYSILKCQNVKRKHKLKIHTNFGGVQGYPFEDLYDVTDAVENGKYKIILSKAEVTEKIHNYLKTSNIGDLKIRESAPIEKIGYELQIFKK